MKLVLKFGGTSISSPSDIRNVAKTVASLTKNNEIGIFISQEYWHKTFGQQALKLLIKSNSRTFYLANINPNNQRSIKFFEYNSFKPYQYTYRLIE